MVGKGVNLREASIEWRVRSENVTPIAFTMLSVVKRCPEIPAKMATLMPSITVFHDVMTQFEDYCTRWPFMLSSSSQREDGVIRTWMDGWCYP